MSTTVPSKASTAATSPKGRSLRRSLVVGLALAAAAYAACSLLIQAVGDSPAGDPAKREQQVLYLLEAPTA